MITAKCAVSIGLSTHFPHSFLMDEKSEMQSVKIHRPLGNQNQGAGMRQSRKTRDPGG